MHEKNRFFLEIRRL